MRRFSIIFCLLALVSCARVPSASDDGLPGIAIPIADMNKDFRLSRNPYMLDTYQFDGTVELDLQHLTEKTLVFPPDFGVKIFQKQGGAWISIQNRFLPSISEFVIYPRSVLTDTQIVDLMPDVPASGEFKLRIVVIGKEQDTNTDVGAYLDVDLSR